MIPDQKSMVKLLRLISGKRQWTDPKDNESRKDLRPGEILSDDFFIAFYGGLHHPLERISIYDIAEWTFLQEIAIIFAWDPFTRPLSRKIHKEWWYIEGRRRSNSQWNLSGFDVAFVQQMVDNLVRCGIFTIEGEMWTFKGFPKGWERKWRKGKSYRVKSFIKKAKELSNDQMMEEKKGRTRKRGRIPTQSGMPLRDSSNMVRSRLPKTDSKSRPRWSAKAPEN